MIDKNNTVFVEKYEYKNVNDLLNEILRRLEIFYKFNGYSPENIKMNPKQYYEIFTHNRSLIKRVDKSYYILGMRVVF